LCVCVCVCGFFLVIRWCVGDQFFGFVVVWFRSRMCLLELFI
jgi:hypothetical protein